MCCIRYSRTFASDKSANSKAPKVIFIIDKVTFQSHSHSATGRQLPDSLTPNRSAAKGVYKEMTLEVSLRRTKNTAS